MKLLRKTKARRVFQLDPMESRVLPQVLALYPRIPPAHQTLSKSAPPPDAEACQRLLDEALAEQRAENKRLLLDLLADPRRFKETAAGSRLSLSLPEAEWLLQILNDIRVGSWLLLGSPEQGTETLTEATAPHYGAMELAGYFQMELLQGLEGK